MKSTSTTESAGSLADTPSAASPLALPVGHLVDHFRIRSQIGSGGMGVVYLAQDTVLGRPVALKLMAGGAAAIERIVKEARTAARFNHPHIVTVHAAGAFSGWPYIAMEYVEGESLRARLKTSRVSVAESIRIGLAIANAVAEAHAVGVLHCDLKPANVMCGQDGRVRVVDFGLASAVGEAAGGGTPRYMAPEQWLSEPLSPAVDIWALGVLLFELFEGESPWATAPGLRPAVTDLTMTPPLVKAEHVPAQARAIVTACLNRQATQRPDAVSVAQALDDALIALYAPSEAETSPFPGLLPYDESRAVFFQGRDDEIAAMAERLRHQPVIPVVGPSGVGKSSLIRGGLIARLRERGGWQVLQMRPGHTPLRTLAVRLCTPLEGSAELADIDRLVTALTNAPGTLNEHLRRIADTGQVLLFIDQLEELLTQASADARDAFIAALAGATEGVEAPARLVLTVREDFLGRLVEDPRLRQLLQHAELLGVPPPTSLRDCIVGPLARAGYAFDDESVVQDMIDGVNDTAGALPLIQFACHQLWARRDRTRRLILKKAYDAIGGVVGALAEHGEHVLAQFGSAELHAARILMLRLVNPDRTRRAVPESQVLDGLGPAGQYALDRLVDARLAVVRKQATAQGRHNIVELAHESLCQSWKRLASWLDNVREDHQLVEELTQAATLWATRGRPTDETWSGPAIAQAQQRLSASELELTATVQAFLDAGLVRANALKRRRRRLQASLIASLLLLTTASLVAAWVFSKQATRINLAAANNGRFRLVLRPIDIDPVSGEITELTGADRPNLRWQLHRPDPDDATEPGPAIEPRYLTISPAAEGEWVEASSGPAFLVVDGRGGPNQTCAPSIIRVANLPGFAERGDSPRVLDIPVPSCRSSLIDTVLVPAGPFTQGGPGVPPTPHKAHIQPKQTVHLDAFRIDRHETRNALHRVYAALDDITGHPHPGYPQSGGVLAHAGDPQYPTTELTWPEAKAWCAYMGKRLPTSPEWEKAARGGHTVAGKPNPSPERAFPWEGPLDAIPRANLAGPFDPYSGPTPVGQLPEGASPYGALDMCGNVDEWTASVPSDSTALMRIVRGSSFGTPLKVGAYFMAYENQRSIRYADFSIGVRCVADAEPRRHPRMNHTR